MKLESIRRENLSSQAKLTALMAGRELHEPKIDAPRLAAEIGSSLAAREDRGPSSRIVVEAATLDDELGMLEGPVVIKLDVEGAELGALQGMREILRVARPLTLFVEVNDEALAGFGATPDDLLTELDALGLETLWIDEECEALVPTAADSRTKGNVLARPMS